jgi:phage-related protein
MIQPFDDPEDPIVPDYNAGRAFLSVIPTLLGARDDLKKQLDEAAAGQSVTVPLKVQVDQAQVAAATAEVEAAESRLAAAREESTRATSEADKAEADLNALRSGGGSSVEAAQAAEQRLSSARTASESASQRVSSIESELGTARTRLTSITSDLGRATDDAAKKTESSGNSADSAGKKFDNAVKGVEGFDKGVSSAAGSAQRFGTVAATGLGIAGLVQGSLSLTSALLPAVGAVALLPALGIAGGAALGTLKIGTQGFGAAIKDIGTPKFAADLAKLSPSARDAATSIASLKPAYDSLQLAVQQSLFLGLGTTIRQLGTDYLPIARTGFVGMASAMNQAVQGVAGFLRAPETIGLMRTTTDNVVTGFRNFSGALEPVFEGLAKVAAVGSTFLPQLGTEVTSVAQKFGAWISSVSSNGQLQLWIATALNVLKQLGEIAGNVGQILVRILSASGQAGSNMLGVLVQLTGGAKDFLNSAQGLSFLHTIFDNIHDALMATQPLVAAVGNALKDVLPIVSAALVNVGKAIGSLAPAVPPLESAIKSIVPVAGQLAGVLAGALRGAIDFLAPIVRTLASALSDVMPFLKAIAPVVGPAALILVGLGTAFVSVGKSLKGVTDAVSGFTKFVGLLKEYEVGAKLAAAAQWLWDTAMDANPIGIIIVIIGLLVVAVIYAYTHFQTFRDIVSDVWNAIKTATSATWSFLVSIFQTSLAFIENLWNTVWGAISTAFTVSWNFIKNTAITVWNAISGFFVGAWDWLSNKWNQFWSAISNLFSSTWQLIKNAAVALWTDIQNFFVGAWDWLSNKWNQFWTDVRNLFSSTWQLIKNAAVALWTDIQNFFVGAWDWLSNKWNQFWTDVRNLFSSTWALIKNDAVTLWNDVSNFFVQGWNWLGDKWNQFWTDVGTTFRNIWNGIKGDAVAIWNDIVNGVKDGINAVINGINALSGGINVVLNFVHLPSIGMIHPLEAGGVVPMYAAGTNRIGGGFKTNGPTAIVGEGRSQYPEYVIPTDPQYRGRASALHAAAGADLGMPKMADGGILGDIGSAIGAAGSWVGGLASSAWHGLTDALGKVENWVGSGLTGIENSAKGLLGSLPAPFTGIGNWIVDTVFPALGNMITTANSPVGGGAAMGPMSASHALDIVNAARAKGLHSDAATIAIMTGMAESGLRILANPAVPASMGLPHDGVGFDHDSVGIFQQRQSWGPTSLLMNPFGSAQLFYNRLGGGPYGDFGAAAQRVQVSAFPGAYSKFQGAAAAMVGPAFASGGVLPSQSFDIPVGSTGILPEGLSLTYNGTGSPETLTRVDTSGMNAGGTGTVSASLAGALVEMGPDGFAQFTDGRIDIALNGVVGSYANGPR